MPEKRDDLPKVGDCVSLDDFIVELDTLCSTYRVRGLAVVVAYEGGNFTSHQFGMDQTGDFEIAAKLLEAFPTHDYS